MSARMSRSAIGSDAWSCHTDPWSVQRDACGYRAGFTRRTAPPRAVLQLAARTAGAPPLHDAQLQFRGDSTGRRLARLGKAIDVAAHDIITLKQVHGRSVIVWRAG